MYDDIRQNNYKLEFKNSLNIRETIKYTVDWYRNFYFEKCDMLSFTKKQIYAFLEQKFPRATQWKIL